ncbi:uncharacterized protein VTP21DRAFT_1713 [Calcarisporiella thermophila]|uniref:uncharacterized protein n=1 Tax=Calcarisporiella thermophila TaxID=911321 RepID=UPI003743875E
MSGHLRRFLPFFQRTYLSANRGALLATVRMSSTNSQVKRDSPFAPSEKVAHFEQDVWSIFTPLAAETKAINLGQGFMNFAPPDFIIEAAQKALIRNECNQYSHPRGNPRLRKAIANSYSPLFDRQINPDTEIMVGAGANEAMLSIFTAYLNQGDEVIIMEPFFDQYVPNISMNGGVPVYLPIRPPAKSSNEFVSSGEWKIDMDELRSKISPRTRIIVLNTPHNPVGKVFSREELLQLSNLAIQHNLLVISDEVYDRLFFSPSEHVRIATLPGMWERTITVGSGGKTFGVTGWRVGWLIGPSNLIEPPLSAHTRIVFCVNSPMQEAIAAGLEHCQTAPYFRDLIESYTSKRDKLLGVFKELGLPCTVPDGSYFILANTSRLRVPSADSGYPYPASVLNRAADFRTCYWLAKEIGVVAIPPTEFYSVENRQLGENFARFAFCKDDATLDLAIERLRKLKDYIL